MVTESDQTTVFTAPTLLLVPTSDADGEGRTRYLAEDLRDARIVQVPGDYVMTFLGNTGPLIEEVEEFLTGVRSRSVQDRVLATVLFSDIVDSAAQAAALGDRLWRQHLDAHDTMVRRLLSEYRGREIKTTGDGFLATFDGPARAIRCACAIRDGAMQLGTSIRVGLHTGEVELRGDEDAALAGSRTYVPALAHGVLD
jgi:hypothetical protein